nr:MAG TPA: hypothetical protein [Caudoviricetes sp.]
MLPSVSYRHIIASSRYSVNCYLCLYSTFLLTFAF